MNRLRAAGLLALLGGFTFLTACSPYKLRGVVIEGNNPGIEIVSQSDPRLQQPGLPSVDVEVRLDPTRFSPEVIGKGQSGRDGSFAVPITEPGAGFLILDVEVMARRERFRSEVKRFDLPGGGKRLVITLQPGKDAVPLENPNILEDTMREAEPFLRRQDH
ncbi:MAG: hypothetical protein AAF333_02110 [Planctomycetota bacterium]